MYERLRIEGFRGIRHLEISRFARINVLIGGNGAGKSSVLESMFLLGNPVQPNLIPMIDGLRGLAWAAPLPGQALAPWRHLFHQGDAEAGMCFSGRARGREWTLRIREAPPFRETAGNPPPSTVATAAVTNRGPLQELVCEVTQDGRPPVRASLAVDAGGTVFSGAVAFQPIVPAIFHAPHVGSDWVQHYGAVEREKRESSVLQFATLIEPRLRRLAVIVHPGGRAGLFGDIGAAELLPVEVLGGGLQNLVACAISVVGMSGQGGVALFDELDAGIHYALFPAMWRGLHRLAVDSDVQVVAATHSWECVQGLLQAELPPEAFLVHRLEAAQDGGVVARPLDEPVLRTAAEMAIEVR